MESKFQSWILVHPQSALAAGEAAAYFGRSIETDPEVVLIAPAEDVATIKIEQVRQLFTLLASRPLTEKGRLVLIAPAESLSLPAQQALLKLLEEPPEKTTLALIARSAAGLPATVASRCAIAILSASETANAGILRQIASAKSFGEQVKLLSLLPTDREVLKQTLATELTSPLPTTPTAIKLKARALEGYEALQVNVTPQLVIDSLLADLPG